VTQNHGRLFYATSSTCALEKNLNTFANIVLADIKQNNEGLLQKLMFNRMPRLQPFQSQFLEMKLQTRKHSSQPLGIQILVNRTAKISCFQVTRHNFNFREPVFPATWENWFQSLETGVSPNWESAITKFQSIRSSVLEPDIFLRLGAYCSKHGKH
jgi:hypothetical protein